jgi:peptidoglycan/xylan/chitin deacetylase (PgdA/CDA1 family)/GT2 family glycosyltransferase
MKVSVIIPTLNRAALFAQTFPSVLAQRMPPDQMEIIVVQDGPDPATTAYLETVVSSFPFCFLTRDVHRGVSRSRNEGIERATGDVILFMDDDVWCDPDLVAHHMRAHEGRAPLATFGRVVVPPDYASTSVIEWARTGDKWVDELAEDPQPRWPEHACIDANCAVTRSALVESGGYVESLAARENAEIGLRLWEMGVPFEFVHGAFGYHCYQKTAQTLVHRDSERYGREEVVLGRLHPGYRAHSLAAHIAEGPWRKRAIRVALSVAPGLSEAVLSGANAVADALPGRRAARVGATLLRARQAAQMHASAVREVGSWRQWREQFATRLPVLLYHHVGRQDLGRHRDLTVSPERFERHVRWLTRRGYKGIRPADWLAWLRDATPLPPKPIIITFDDAYEELAEHALPVLERYGHASAVFVITGLVDRGKSWEGAPVMSGAQILEWRTRGVEFGSHTRTHPDLRTLDDDALRDELEGSRDDLAALLGAPPLSFAYPYGFHGDRVRDMAERFYPLAFALLPGVNEIGTDRLRLLRTVVQSGDTAVNLALRAGLGYDPIERLRARLAIRTRVKRLLGLPTPG